MELTIRISILFVVLQVDGNAASIAVMGQRARCSNEGETIAVDSIDKKNCFSCICKNGLVECFSGHSCPEISGCHMLIDKTSDDCCSKCQGCYYNGIYHQSYTEWTQPDKPCTVMKCEAGVVTKSELQCHIPCENPIPPAPGKCCSTCPDCRINGQVATDDKDVTSGDLCVKCSCRRNKMTCSKQACPVLQCSKHDQTKDPGECCPKCDGIGTHFQATHICLLGKKVYKEGETTIIDQCTKCKCVNQTSICERRTCPILNCASDLQKKRPNSCCKECVMPQVEEIRSQCSLNDKVYEEGQSWTLNACTVCKCHGGMISCAKTLCNTTLPCAYGTHLVHHEGECCDKCEEIKSEAACMVFGNTHYKTFDGKIFTFQGLGKYQLVSDCQNRTFSVRITNDYSNRNRTSVVTKRVRVKYHDTRINLGQKYRVRMNGGKTTLPHKSEGIYIVKSNDGNLLVTFNTGVKLTWNSRGFLEVIVPTNYKSKLCGLCGNFNSNVQDDLKMRKGGVVDDRDILKFGFSWCVGKDCAKQMRRTLQINACKLKSHRRHTDKNPCKYLTSTELFNECDTKLNYIRYYNSCLKDMCDCPGGRCYCESLMAYAQECKRLEVDVSNWQKNSYCQGGNDTKLQTKQKQKSPVQIYSTADIERLTMKLGKKRNRGNEPMIH